MQWWVGGRGQEWHVQGLSCGPLLCLVGAMPAGFMQQASGVVQGWSEGIAVEWCDGV